MIDDVYFLFDLFILFDFMHGKVLEKHIFIERANNQLKNSGAYNQNIKNNVFLRTSVLFSVFESINFNNKNTFNDDPLYHCTLEINNNFVTQHSRFCFISLKYTWFLCFVWLIF